MPTNPFHIDSIRDVAHLEDLLTTPTEGAIESVKNARGDFMVLGAGGKVGPTLTRMIARCVKFAGTKAKVYGIDKAFQPDIEKSLQADGVQTISCDMLAENALAKLPEAQNVVFMAGMKFGATGAESLTWAMNAYLPAIVAHRFKNSRIAVFSTGNTYGMRPILSGGSRESDPQNPNGEYAMSCMGRERMFQHVSLTHKTPVTLIRLNYAVELRYGVLIDLATRIWNDQEVDLSTGSVNIIWQGDVNAMTIQCLDIASSPAVPINFAGPELLNVRQISEMLAAGLGKPLLTVGAESPNIFNSNCLHSHYLYGYPRVDPRRLILWTCDWIKKGGASLGKPTHFDTRDGKY